MTAELADRIRTLAEGRERVLVGIAGPPGVGKSTLSERLAAGLGREAVVVPMDGFHLDNAILERRGLKSRKGAPETFDATGFVAMLKRLRDIEEETMIPVFDRNADLARAAGRGVRKDHRILIIEGNYLLLRQTPWNEVGVLLDLTVLLKTDLKELESRLIRRWLDQGLSPRAAADRARGNDLANAELVLSHSAPAAFTIRT
jgi:pantothenate kinase